MRLNPADKLDVHRGEEEQGVGEQTEAAFYYAPFCCNGNKAALFCCSSTLGGYEVTSVQESMLIHLKGFGARSSSEIGRLINVPLTALGENTYTHTVTCTHTRCACLCVYGCIIIVGTICSTLSPHSHLFI